MIIPEFSGVRSFATRRLEEFKLYPEAAVQSEQAQAREVSLASGDQPAGRRRVLILRSFDTKTVHPHEAR
jgi:hypothetical protein